MTFISVTEKYNKYMYFSPWTKLLNDSETNIYFILDTKYSSTGNSPNNSQPLSQWWKTIFFTPLPLFSPCPTIRPTSFLPTTSALSSSQDRSQLRLWGLIISKPLA